MNRKISRILKTNIILYSLCLIAFVVAAIPVSPLLAAAEAAAVVLIFLFSRRNSASAQKSVRQYMERYTGGMDSARSSNMLYAPMGMVVFDFDSNTILWGNDQFHQMSGRKEDLFDAQIDDVITDFQTHWLVEGKRECPDLIEWNGRQFRVFGSISRADEIAGVKGSLATTYWMDVTETEEMRATLEETRPVAAILMVDNYEDLMKACPESKRSAVLAAVEEKIGQWTADAGGMLLKYDRDRYLFLFEERSFPGYAERRFDLLDQVREVVAGEGVAAFAPSATTGWIMTKTAD